MEKIKVMTVFGTRPEAIKMCPLVKKLEKDDRFKSIVCVTAQHRSMLDSVLDTFKVIPDHDLNLMSENQSIIDLSNKILSGVDLVIKKEKPDIVLVHGDTSTTLNSALASFYNKVPIGHVEAGLRSNDIYSPFPEEVNRRLTSAITSLHFTPTESNKENLLKEGVDDKTIFVTGNTVIDALLDVVEDDFEFSSEILKTVDFKNDKVILLTTHRRENIGQAMENIFKAIIRLIEVNNDIKVIFPVHKNPKVRELANKYFNNLKNRVIMIEPLEYVEFSNLMKKVHLIMTDSGGIQEEAPTLNVPVCVLRTETERPEAIECGTVKLVGVDENNIFESVNELLNNELEYDKVKTLKNPYGDGKASDRILDILNNYFSKNKN
ncbi:non-hydrolyzing UDP-N-acetylglucosamine 2-epimerase [Clostridium perfringens]|uniref:non-hydrolyzing UDP-N-acetylglucosamine 2-epimerase n=1 Tax=Clostridium perfringens TaxID=1502 RepID=UPI0039EBC2C3